MSPDNKTECGTPRRLRLTLEEDRLIGENRLPVLCEVVSIVESDVIVRTQRLIDLGDGVRVRMLRLVPRHSDAETPASIARGLHESGAVVAGSSLSGGLVMATRGWLESIG